MTALALSCSGVAVRLREATVLRDLDLHVPAGTLTTVVGPSGAGKTTLLRVVAGLERLSAGSIRLGSCNLGPLPSHRRGLAVVFQEPRLFPNLTIGENVAFPLRMAGVNSRDRNTTAHRLLDEVGLPGTAERAVRGLSGGEQQRVALARALAANPDLLLLDEPLSAVDPNRREDLRHLIAAVQREREVTTLYVTHDRAEAAELGDRVALLIEGRVLQHAPPEELFERPSTSVVARFFGATNVLSGWVTAGRFRTGGVDLPVDAADGAATVVIRPERLSLSDRGPVRGQVVASSYQGTHRRVVVDCAGTVLEAHLDSAAPVAAGDRVRLDVAAEHVWSLPSGADRSQRR